MESKTSSLTYSQTAYNYILDALQRGVYAPGQDISDADIAEHLGISRMPVREAIIWLSKEGYLETYPRKGTFVTKYSLHEILDIYAIRLKLEPSIISASCGDIRPDQIRILRDFRAYNQKFVNDDSLVTHSGEFFVQDTNLHLFLFALTQNRFFQKVATNALTQCVIAKTDIYRRLGMSHNQTANAHIRIIDAMVDGDSSLAEKAMYDHLMSIQEALLDYYTRGRQ